MVDSWHNTVDSNIITKNNIGIFEYGGYNIIKNNYIIYNTVYGFNMAVTYVGFSDKICNNYVCNNKNVLTVNSGPVSDIIVETNINTDKELGENIIGGQYIGGNYWAKPDGTGYSQTHPDLDGDGICDDPYLIDQYFTGSNVIQIFDQYPLTNNENQCGSEIPEFPTIALPLIAIVGLALFFKRK